MQIIFNCIKLNNNPNQLRENTCKINDVKCTSISFTSKSDAANLMKCTDILNCAYTGKPMILKESISELMQKLFNKKSAYEALEILKSYAKYIYNPEIFQMLLKSPHLTKFDIRDIFQENYSESLDRLKRKQRNVLNSTERIQEQLGSRAKKKVERLKEETEDRIEDGSFSRTIPLKALRAITGAKKDENLLKQIYRAWYQLPRSSKDLDAFVVSNAKLSQDSIIKKMISPSEVSIDHIKASSEGGPDELNNYLLVCNQPNSEKNSMTLDEYSMLNPDLNIAYNLQQYVNAAIHEINYGSSWLSSKFKYPDGIQKTVLQESSGFILLDTDGLTYKKFS